MKHLILLSLITLSQAVLATDNCKTLVDNSEQLSDQGNWAKAIETAKKAVQTCSTEKQKTARPYMVLATAYNAIQDFEQTVHWSQEALKQEPDLGLAYMDMCAGYMGLEKYDEAIAACKNGLKKPNEWTAKINYNTGMAIFKKYVALSQFEKVSEAEPYFKASQKLMPKENTTYYYIGLITQTGGKNKEALEQFTKGCELGNQKSCEAKTQMMASAQKPTAQASPAPAKAAKAAPASPEEEKLWAQVKAAYLKKGVPAASVDSMINEMKNNFSSLPADQRMTTLKSMASQL